MTRRDEGMTLIELLMSVSLLTVIMTGLVTAMLLVLDTTDASRSKVTDSSGAQLLTSYLVSDVQSSDFVQPASGCSVPSGASLVLELRWTDAATASTVTDVQYTTEPNGNGNSQLTRYVFDGSCTQTDKVIIVRALSTASCTTPCTSAATQLGLDVTALSPDAKTGNYTPYTFEVLGSRRTK